MPALLIGLDSDLHLDSVLLELKRNGQRVIRLNPERMTPENTRISWSPGSNAGQIVSCGEAFALRDVRSVFCRYAMEAMRTDSNDPIDRFVFDELWVAIRGVLAGSIPSLHWINDPFREAWADHKPLQLAMAKSIGLRIPSTIISQDKDELAAFASNGPCVIKHLGDTGIVAHGDSFSNELDHAFASDATASFTAKLDPMTLEDPRSDLSCPVFLQECIEKDFDLRVTVIDDNAFAAKLSPEPGANIDIRNNKDVGVSRFDLDSDTSNRLVTLVRELGLRYAACDFVSRNGELFFLEANPSGNWLWTELGANLPISEAIASRLAGS